MPILSLVPALLNLAVQGIPIAISIATAAKTEWDLFTSGASPTAAQQAAIDAALEDANNTLQSAKQATA